MEIEIINEGQNRPQPGRGVSIIGARHISLVIALRPCILGTNRTRDQTHFIIRSVRHMVALRPSAQLHHIVCVVHIISVSINRFQNTRFTAQLSFECIDLNNVELQDQYCLQSRVPRFRPGSPPTPTRLV